MSNPTENEIGPAQDYHGYEAALAAAIRVLTDAARLRRRRLRTDDGTWVEGTASAPEQVDWAEFVTLALAGAAANVGGIDTVLSGRSGSWEAEGVRQLLYSTVGADEAHLWTHRTDPLDITLYVDELLTERSDAWREYDDAQQELDRRYEAAKAAEPAIDYTRYVWEYDRNDTGEWVPRDPAAPVWSIEAWRQAYADDEGPEESRSTFEAMLLGERAGLGGQPVDSTHLPKSPEAARELARLEAERDARHDSFGEVGERLEAQRLREWAAYGAGLRSRVQALASALPGLEVPVEVAVDVTTYRRPAEQREGLRDSLESRLIDSAVMDTPTPVDLPGTPLERLQPTSG